MHKKSNFKLDLTSGLTALFTVVLWLAATFSGLGLRKLLPDYDGLPLFLMLLVAFAVACAVNRIAAKIFAREHFGMHPDERRKLYESHHEACKEDAKAVLANYKDIETVPLFLLGLYFVLVFAMGVAAPLCLFPDCGFGRVILAILGIYLSGSLFFMPILRICQQLPERLNREVLVSKDELPILESMARKAADAVGVKGPIRLELTRECDVDVIQLSGTYVVLLGARLLSVLTEEEVYQRLLLSFDYFNHRKEYRKVTRLYRLGLLGAADIRGLTFAFDLFFSYADATLEWEYDFYSIAFKRYMDSLAYERVKAVGDPRVTVNALCKEHTWRFFVFEVNQFLHVPFYLEPKPHDHFEWDVCSAYRRALTERWEQWMAMLEREIRPAGNRLPLLRDIRSVLDPDSSEYPKDPGLLNLETSYGLEVSKAIRKILEPRLQIELTPTYKYARQREYLEPLKITEAYEADPSGYTTPELSPVINAYRDLSQYDKAEAVCDTILETETNQFALAHAIYFKGMMMLHRYETEGIDLIYRAIDLNKNYMQDGFEMVEEYCTMCGLADEYEHFLRRAVNQMSAHAYNHEVAGSLNPHDHLIPEESLGDMLPDILGYMTEAADGCLREIYLVRKVISEEFFTSAFVINFEYGTPEETMRRTYQAIFNYLDAYPVDWQFSLFIYDRVTEAAVKRVANSRVWQKENLTI